MDTKLLDVLVCPVTKTSLVYRETEQELWCRGSGLAGSYLRRKGSA